MTIRALSLFSGIGGLDLGAQLAGIEVCLATDVDDAALHGLHASLGTRVVAGDIDELLVTGQLESQWPAAEPPDLVIGGPPCTAFSHAGFWLDHKRNGDDPAAHMLTSFIEAVRTFRPRAFVMENVPGLAFKTHDEAFTDLIKALDDLGYSVSWTRLTASDFGVPQARTRLFVVGVKGSDPVRLEEWPAFPQRSASWALDGLGSQGAEPGEVPTGKYEAELAQVPPGMNYLALTKERGHPEGLFKYRGRYWSFLLKLHPDKPSSTIPAQRVTWNGPFHWEGRHLRSRELARLQSFPDWYVLDENPAVTRRHVGNAVPPLLGAAVIWRVREALAGHEIPLPSALHAALDPNATCPRVLEAYPRTVGPDGAVPVAS